MSEQTISQFIAGNAFFEGLAPEYAAFLAEHGKTRHLQASDVLFHHGQPARRFYVIASGEISVEVAAIEGPALELQRLSSGAVIGWSWLIPPYRWSFQARALTPTDIVEFDGPSVLARCEQDPRFGYELLKRFSGLMSERLQLARQTMMQAWKPAGFA